MCVGLVFFGQKLNKTFPTPGSGHYGATGRYFMAERVRYLIPTNQLCINSEPEIVTFLGFFFRLPSFKSFFTDPESLY
jgi:hypothetical protein